MEESTSKVLSFSVESPSSALDAVLRRGAQKMLIEAIEAEVAEFIEARRTRSTAKVAGCWSATGTCPS